MAAATSVRLLSVWVTIFYGTCLALCVVASPTRRQFVAYTETTSPEPAAFVTIEGDVWNDNDDFNLAGDVWQPHASPSPIPDYDDYEYDAEEQEDPDSNVLVDLDDDDHDDPAHAQNRHVEYLLVPPKETRIVLSDDDGPIKVRHTGKGSYARVSDADDDDEQFEFTMDDEGVADEDGKDGDDFDLEEEPKEAAEEDNSVEVLPSQEVRAAEDNDGDDDEEEFENDLEGDDEMFENPDDDAAQVIYGDHVFLY